MAAAALDALPMEFSGPAAAVVLQIADWPAPEMLAALNIETREELTGLYEGIPLTEKSSFDQPMGPDVIWLFREPILSEWRARGDIALADLITHVLVHELAHHFGWSDDDIALVDRWWE
ncbi:metallopeptidase family protein [Phaeobacter sp. J2-8]|uniref:metallopeptidase family protein n=2 Tax=Roseobacteraceae TaxID=2854170 RepID=UPI001FD5415D|nr:metallopeptidase family protein [Phaeobacter sp. J2-8]MCJ7873060.1 metallopeptidase family protein [Phaeobacter sp. J2-8]